MTSAGAARRPRSISGPFGRIVGAALATAAVVVVAVIAPVGPAGAHTDLIQGSPGPGQRIGGVVDFVDLVFAAPVTEVEVEVVGPDGSVRPGSMVVADGQIIRYEMEVLAEPGRYLVEYQMISDDGDFTVGSYFFDYDEAAVTPMRLGRVDVPDDRLLTVPAAVGAVAVIALVVACVVLVRRLRRSRAELTTRRQQQTS